MTDIPNFTKLVPGFDFLQSLVSNAGATLPSIGKWVAPVLNPEELEKRIEELRTVQFWLEQNARMLGTTIQALEVQRMTLSTLKTMNVQMGDLQEAMKIRLPDPPAKTAAAQAQADTPSATQTEKTASAGIVDPMQWWGALTQQFTELATTALKDHPAGAARTFADSMVKQGLNAAEKTMNAAAEVAKTAGKMPGTGKPAGKGTRRAAPARKRKGTTSSTKRPAATPRSSR